MLTEHTDGAVRIFGPGSGTWEREAQSRIAAQAQGLNPGAGQQGAGQWARAKEPCARLGQLRTCSKPSACLPGPHSSPAQVHAETHTQGRLGEGIFTGPQRQRPDSDWHGMSGPSDPNRTCSHPGTGFLTFLEKEAIRL